jgi:hypothetical protein
MEISNEIRIKILAQYLGQRITLDNGKTTELLTIHLLDKLITNGLWWTDLKLILKPQSTSMAMGVEDYKSMKEIESITEQLLKDTVGKDDFVYKMMLSSYLSFQYSISKGIDLPNFLLGGKTLYESNLCVYE